MFKTKNSIKPRTWIEINLTTIRRNIDLLKKNLSPGSNIMVMVKANGYGHGLVKMAEISQQAGCRFVGVSFIDEAITLRQNKIKTPILLFTQPEAQTIPLIFKYKITPIVYSIEFLKNLSYWSQKKRQRIKIHIKINTGLNRFGFNAKNIEEVANIIKEHKRLIPEGALTHFSSADSDDKTTKTEFQLFMKIVKKSNLHFPILHVSNSAASIWHKKYHLNLVRIGLAAYGLQPSLLKKNPIPIKQGFCWKTKIIDISKINKNGKVGYGGKWVATKPSVIGIIPVGYSDGFRRTPSNYNHVLCCGKEVPIVGMVMMNHTILNLTDISQQVKLGDEVVLIGKQGNKTITFENAATSLNTINEEVAVSISAAIPRLYYTKDP